MDTDKHRLIRLIKPHEFLPYQSLSVLIGG